jgi:hypothetical protein
VPVAHPLDLAPGSVRLNMGEFFSMSGMMRNLENEKESKNEERF